MVYVFASRDAAVWPRARELALEVGAHLVDRLSTSLEDLRLVVRYQIVEPAVVLVLDGEDVVARIPRLPTTEEVVDLLRS